MKGRVLVTGGAGYIGSHIVKNVLKEGFLVSVLDNLSSGFIEPIENIRKNLGEVEFIKGDLADKENLSQIFHSREIDTVMHLAARIDVVESFEKPKLYHDENYVNSVNLVESCVASGVKNFIFSSTAAVYGKPEYTPIDENHSTNPLNPYGQTKLDFEKYLKQTKNLNYVILRYFNVGGSDPQGILGKSHLKSKDLIENILKVALGQKEEFQIYGNDFSTPDGTAIRDFVHVEDVARAHIIALNKINKVTGEVFNLGSEEGFSVKEIIDRASHVTGKNIPTKVYPRRVGDTDVSVASSAKAREILGWEPRFSDLDSIIGTDWGWRKNHPLGYTS